MCTFNKGMLLKIKGGFVFFHPKKIIFTSPERPETEFAFRTGIDHTERTLRDDFGHFRRRCKNIV